MVPNKNLITNMILKRDNRVFINIMTEIGNVTVGSQYSSPSDELENDLNDWGDVEFVQDRFLVAGDFNGGDGKNRLWVQVCSLLTFQLVPTRTYVLHFIKW